MTVTKTKRYRFYKNRPVKRMRRGPNGIVLTFVSPVSGQPGRQEIITQADWNQFGEWRELPSTQADYLRRLAR